MGVRKIRSLPGLNSDDSKMKKIERSRIFELLTGLNPVYDQVLIQILDKEPLLFLNQIYSYLQIEESKKSAMLPPSVSGKSVFVSSS